MGINVKERRRGGCRKELRGIIGMKERNGDRCEGKGKIRG